MQANTQRQQGEKMKEKETSIAINSTDSLELQARNVGNAIANGMMQRPGGINHKGHDCIVLSVPFTCEYGYCSKCHINLVESMKSIERQNTEMTRGY